MRICVIPSRAKGCVTVPPSKSIAHRALLCAALSNGVSRIFPVCHSADVDATAEAIRTMGAETVWSKNGVTVRGISAMKKEPLTLFCGESGSTLRFLIPICALRAAPTTFTGAGRLLSRPLSVYQKIFKEQGLSFVAAPEKVTLAGRLKAGTYSLSGGVSSQFITGLLFALPLLDGDSMIRIAPPFESAPYVKMTLGVLRSFGVKAAFQSKNEIAVPGNQHFSAADYCIERDYSQLAFFAVLGALNGEVLCRGVPETTLQGDGVIVELLRSFGAHVKVGTSGITVSSCPLTGQEIDLADCPDLGPILMTAAAFARGTTHIRNAGRLRLKESDRIAAMEEELTRLNVPISSDRDSVEIGCRGKTPANVTVFCHNDHRIAMSLAVFAACCEQPIILEGAECVNKSYPDFFDDLQQVGIKIERIGE